MTIKPYAFLWFCTLSVGLATAQVFQGTSNVGNNTGDLRYGAKAAFLLNDWRGDGIVDNNPLPGFQVGGALELPIDGEIHFAPELLVSLRGTKGVNDQLRTTYVEIPLLGRYYITEEIAVELGPHLGFMIGDNSEDFNLETRSVDVGIGLGGGYFIDGNIYLQLRFQTGFLQVIEDVDVYNIGIHLGGIYYF